MIAFKWGTTWPCMSRGCKTAGRQSSPRPGIEPGPRRLLHKNVASNPKCQRFFWPPTLTVRSFVTAWDTETYNTSFERSDVWLLSGYTFRGVAVLFRPATPPQSTPTLLHISAIGPYSFSETVCSWHNMCLEMPQSHLLCCCWFS